MHLCFIYILLVNYSWTKIKFKFSKIESSKSHVNLRFLIPFPNIFWNNSSENDAHCICVLRTSTEPSWKVQAIKLKINALCMYPLPTHSLIQAKK